MKGKKVLSGVAVALPREGLAVRREHRESVEVALSGDLLEVGA